MRFFCTVSFLMYAAIAGRAQDLRAGYAKADITPAEPVMMGGYDLRGAPSDGIHFRRRSSIPYDGCNPTLRTWVQKNRRRRTYRSQIPAHRAARAHTCPHMPTDGVHAL